LPRLEIRSAIHPEEAWDFVEEAEIILSWQIHDELLKRAKCLRWFSRQIRSYCLLFNSDVTFLLENSSIPLGCDLA
jgi:hypothetical protein